MELNSSQIEFIKSNKSLLQRNDFDGFFKKVRSSDRRIYANFFYSIGLDIFEFLKDVPDYLFYGSTQLKGVHLPDNVRSIGSYAFANCTDLSTVTMSDSVISIMENAFSGCRNLNQVKLSNSLNQIPTECFVNDTSLKEIFLPDSVIQLRPGAFDNCNDIVIYANYRSDASRRLRIKQIDLDFYKSHLKFKHPNKETQTEKFNFLTEAKLTEDFSPSMPKWLRARLLYTKSSDSRRAMPKGRYADFSKQPDTTFTDKKRKDQEYLDLWAAMSKAGIDISNANFIQDGLPRPKKDTRLEEPNIAFFYLDDGSVYGTGLNDNEIFQPEGKAFKAVNLKTLMSHIRDFCWLDGSDPNNFMGSKRELRGKTKQELQGLGDYYRYKELRDAGPGHSPWSGWKLDKSGYLIDPNKFKNKLKEFGKKNISANLERIYNDLKNLQMNLGQVLMDWDFRNNKNQKDFDKVFKYNGLLRDFTFLKSHYNNIASKVESALAETDPETKDRILSNLSSAIISLKDEIKNFKKSGSEIFDVEVDWDTNESLRHNKLDLDESLFNEDIENLLDIDLSAQNPVMQQADEQSTWVKDQIDKELEEIEKNIPDKNSEKVIGALKQPVPDKIKEPKMELDESLFTEAVKNYEYIDLGYIDRVKCGAKVYDDGSIWVNTYHPYDDADYHWAVSKDDGIGYKIYIHSPGKFVKSIVMGGYDDKDELISQVKEVAQELISLDRNSKIRSRMMHN